MFFEATGVHGFDSAFDAVDGELRRGDPDDGTEFFMGSLDSSVILIPIPFPEDPSRGYGGQPMGTGDLRQGRQEDRV